MKLLLRSLLRAARARHSRRKTERDGGAIAIGHPLGATGARIAADLFAEMQRTNKEYGVVSMCVGGGSGNGRIVQAGLELNLKVLGVSSASK